MQKDDFRMFLDWHIPQTILASEHFLPIHLHCIWTIIPSLSHHLCIFLGLFLYTCLTWTFPTIPLNFSSRYFSQIIFLSICTILDPFLHILAIVKQFLPIHLCLLGLFFHFTASLGSFPLSISSLSYSYLSLPLLNGSHLFTSASLRLTYSCFSQTILVYLFKPVLICLTNKSLHTYLFLFSSLYLSITQCFHVYVFLNLSVISDQ